MAQESAKSWRDQVMDIMIAVESDNQFDAFLPSDDAKPFILRATEEMMKAAFPSAKLKSLAAFAREMLRHGALPSQSGPTTCSHSEHWTITIWASDG